MKLVQLFLRKRLSAIEQRNAARNVESETAVFDRLGLMVLISLFVIFATITIFQGINPPPDVAIAINENPEKFVQFKAGKIFFSEADSPREIGTQVKKHAITLPFRSAQKIEGYRKNGIWYEFEILIPKDKYRPGETALLIPLVWGQSKVFRNGELFSYGKNHWPLIPADDQPTTLLIRSDLTGFQFSNPILATFPLIAGSVEDLREVVSTVEQQIEAGEKSQVPFLAAIAFIGAFFLAYRKRPELFAFLGFLVASYFYALIVFKTDTNQMIFISKNIQSTLIISLDFVLNSFLLLFSLLFFRISFYESVKRMKWSLLAIALVGSSIAFTAFSWGAGPSSLRQIFHIVISASFLSVQLWFLLPELLYLLSSSSIPRMRKATSIFVVLAITSVYILNITDYFGLLTTVTTEYRNGFLIYMVLSMFVAFEAARAEGHKRKLSLLLSSEAKRGIELGENEIGSHGFVILVDAIDFSINRGSFESLQDKRRLVKEIFGPIAEAVSDYEGGKLSFLSTTGDGLYLSLKSEPTQSGLETALEIAAKIVYREDVKGLSLRAAVGFGSYTVILFGAGRFQKELVIGGVLNDLSRIIGGQGVRVLNGLDVSKLKVEGDLKKIEDKHGYVHSFFDVPIKARSVA